MENLVMKVYETNRIGKENRTLDIPMLFSDITERLQNKFNLAKQEKDGLLASLELDGRNYQIITKGEKGNRTVYFCSNDGYNPTDRELNMAVNYAVEKQHPITLM